MGISELYNIRALYCIISYKHKSEYNISKTTFSIKIFAKNVSSVKI